MISGNAEDDADAARAGPAARSPFAQNICLFDVPAVVGHESLHEL